jgi:hypothetical protein
MMTCESSFHAYHNFHDIVMNFTSFSHILGTLLPFLKSPFYLSLSTKNITAIIAIWFVLGSFY